MISIERIYQTAKGMEEALLASAVAVSQYRLTCMARYVAEVKVAVLKREISAHSSLTLQVLALHSIRGFILLRPKTVAASI